MPGGTNKTMEEAYEETKERERQIKGMGYNMVIMWSCELKRAMDRDPQMKEEIEAIEVVWPLDAREGLFGVKIYFFIF